MTRYFPMCTAGVAFLMLSVCAPNSQAQSPAQDEQRLLDILQRIRQESGRRFVIGQRYEKDDAGQIVALSLRRMEFEHADYEVFGRLRHVERIDLIDSNIQDADLAQLAKLSNLRELRLFGTEISDEGISNLRGLTKLESLDVSDTKVTDRVAGPLKSLTGLRHLAICRCDITDQRIQQFAEISLLESIKLEDTHITDQALPHLLTMPKLRGITLEETAVTSNGLAILASDQRFAWMASPRKTIDELIRRMENGDRAGVDMMLSIGLTIPDRGNYEFVSLDAQPFSENDEKRERQRFYFEMHWTDPANNTDEVFHATVGVEKGTVSIHNMGIKVDDSPPPKKKPAPGKPTDETRKAAG